MTLSYLLAVIFIAECGLMLVPVTADNDLVFDDTPGYGRTFDGIGGISGGGATSKLLVNYPKQLRDQILDFLFLPNFGASLQILKVEIGGDVQSTDGTEASHMHNSWEENYQRGYEWWLMLEAKKRNPDIKLYALPWGFPGWIGKDKNPFTNNTILADYIVKWINGAKTHYNLTIDYIGLWNERSFDIDYIKTLRAMLDERGFRNVLIIASDSGWEIAPYVKKDPELAKDIYALGAHYPGTWASGEALSTGLVLWASEDYSTYNDEVGAGCWARILNQNYVNGLMTSTISWDLIASYYEGLPYFRDGLMTAVEPWSGNYVVQSPIWVSAHTTQFTSIGWKYLSHKYGVGYLPEGGSYVGLVSPSGNNLTIVLETMSHDHSVCIRPRLKWYTIQPQNVTITLKGRFAKISQLFVWRSQLEFDGTESKMFINLGPVKVVNGSVQISLGVDEIYTLTTLPVGLKGSYPPSPPSSPFPLPYKDDFEGYNLYEEPFYLAQQTGSFEIIKNGNNQFLRQMVLRRPLTWCDVEDVDKAINVIGNSTWQDIFVEIDFNFPDVNASSGVFVAARIDKAGCDLQHTRGIFLFATETNYTLTTDPYKSGIITTGALPASKGWHKLSLFVQGKKGYGAFDGKGLFTADISSGPTAGFAGLGTADWGLADFDSLYIASKEEGMAQMQKYFPNPLSQPLYFVKERN